MLIYKAPMEYYLAACNYVTTASAILFTGYSILEFINKDKVKSSVKQPYGLMRGKVQVAETDVKYFAIACVVFNVALRILMHRYPLRIYKNANK